METVIRQTIPLLESVVEDCRQAAREIYYAISYTSEDNPARANLFAALKLLGVNSPSDVGLSNSVLKYRNYVKL